MAADEIALLYSALGGFFMGTYVVPIKTPSVLKAGVHPVVFQLFKSSWVFLLGWLFVLYRLIAGKDLVFCFTPWGFLSAAAWIPSGLSTIASVPRIGVGLGIVLNSGTSSILTFLAGWLILGEDMKLHAALPGPFHYLAPYLLACIVLGMTALVAISHLSCNSARSVEGLEALNARPAAAPPRMWPTRDTIIGVGFAFLGGFCSAIQYCAVSFGKRSAQQAAGCDNDPDSCPDWLKEEFDDFGSWPVSFGIGSILVTLIVVTVFSLLHKAQGKPPLDPQLGVMKVPGSIAGCFWFLGNLFQVAASLRGGAAVMMPANYGIQLVCSGAWGIIYYREVKEPLRIFLWAGAAAWTLTSIILLSREKA
eukprot:TRINITY_DN30969_c0_g1_i1.p1 TRINITY_DN30969_c0_g1~~TRINITY_DN30969_c0_g1_i1.p1  ORF type:complete len:384 (-),score=49.79 TRINITY_DN30969_c0_g1_i1:113-1204(-)